MALTELIVLYDGVCNFCNASVQFIIDRDPNAVFKFAALQSSVGKALLCEVEKKDSAPVPRNLDSIVLLEDNTVFVKSTASLRIARHLSGAWSWVYFLIWIPLPIRDFFYTLFAKYRYKLFGKSESCRIPTPEIRERFLDVTEDGLHG